ncbi:MAG: Skp family chaperone for outer membrane protein [Verrucomicrobiales bacterium]|jgi:Skp family chaperone for outer membrane proteins
MKLTLALTAFILLSLATGSAVDLKIGVIDFSRIQEEFNRTATEREEFELKREYQLAAVAEKRKQAEGLIAAQRKLVEEIGDPTLSGAAKARKREEARTMVMQIRSLQLEIQEFEANANSELAKSAQIVQRKLTSAIYEKPGELAEAKGFDLVFNHTFGINGVPTVAYRSDHLVDFSDEVIAALNGETPAAAEE